MSLDENLSSDRLHVMIQSSVWVHMINEASDHFPRSSKKARLMLALNKKMPNIQEISTPESTSGEKSTSFGTFFYLPSKKVIKDKS